MKKNVIDQMVALLEKLKRGDTRAAREFRALVKPFRTEDGLWFKHPDLDPEQGNAVGLLIREWEEMFSYKPGRQEGLLPLIALLQWLQTRAKPEVLELYERPEWRELMALRGPADCVMTMKCQKCKTKYPALGISGFLDLLGLYCPSCGHVLFRSLFSETPPPSCSCGGSFIASCPSCGSTQSDSLHRATISPYQYFARHGYTVEKE